MMVMRLFSLNPQAPCWLRIRTKTPKCVYFFGPFDSRDEARDHQDGYITDLTQEGAQGIRVTLQRKEPTALTIAQEFDR
jgi:hypothetical protein